jgi:predicted transcriptional regulator
MNMVRGQAANTRVTVDLGSAALYRRVKVLAAYQGRPLREIVVEALKDWVEKQEEIEDLQDFLAAAGEPGRPLREIMAELGE